MEKNHFQPLKPMSKLIKNLLIKLIKNRTYNRQLKQPVARPSAARGPIAYTREKNE